MNRQQQKEQLLQLRGKLVGVLQTHPGSIYPDETITALLDAQPKSIEELTKVKGFPADGKRVKTFGNLVVGIFNPSKQNVTRNSKQMDAFSLPQGTSKSTQNPSQKKLKVLALVSLAGWTGLLRLAYPSYASVSGQSVAVCNNIEKYRYMVASKQEAKENWESKQKELFIRKLSEEAAKEKAERKAVARATERKKRLKAQTISKVKVNVKTAQKKSMQVAKDAEAYCKKLEKLAAEKKKKAAAMSLVSAGTDDYTTALKDYVSFPVGNEGRSEWKSWMSYLNDSNTDSIFNKSSAQYALQQRAYTGAWGIRMVEGRYCIAVASAYASTIGTKIDVVLDSGSVIKCILGDQKANADTDSLNRYHLSDGSYIEFIVSRDLIDDRARTSGSFNCIFEGPVREIRVQR